MPTTIRSHHVDITDPIRDYVNKKMSKLEKFATSIMDIIVDLDVEGGVSNEDEQQTVSVLINCTGATIRAEDSSRDIYASVDNVFQKLERQLVRYTEKRRERHRDHNKRTVDGVEALQKNTESTIKRPEIMKLGAMNKGDVHYIAKPMFPEDAAIHLSDSPLKFIVFRNAESEEINVIYKKDKEFVLIET